MPNILKKKWNHGQIRPLNNLLKKTPCIIIRDNGPSEDGTFVPPIQEDCFFLTWGSQNSSIIQDDGYTYILSAQTVAIIARTDGRVEMVRPELLIFPDINKWQSLKTYFGSTAPATIILQEEINFLAMFNTCFLRRVI